MIRVTEVLNYFKEPWYVDWFHDKGRREANKVSKMAMKTGSRVDELIKSNASSGDAKDKEEVHNCMAAYRKWLDVYKPGSITPCTRLHATIEGQEVTGEPDLMVDDVLVDIKCSGRISPSYWVQVNMYADLFRKQEPFKGQVAILRLDKNTSSYEYVVKDYDKFCVDVWCGLMRAYVYYKGDSSHGDEL